MLSLKLKNFNIEKFRFTSSFLQRVLSHCTTVLNSVLFIFQDILQILSEKGL